MTTESPLQLSRVPIVVREVLSLKIRFKLFPAIMHMLHNHVYENPFLHFKKENVTKTFTNVTKTFTNLTKSFSNVTKTFTNVTNFFY